MNRTKKEIEAEIAALEAEYRELQIKLAEIKSRQSEIVGGFGKTGLIGELKIEMRNSDFEYIGTKTHGVYFVKATEKRIYFRYRFSTETTWAKKSSFKYDYPDVYQHLIDRGLA